MKKTILIIISMLLLCSCAKEKSPKSTSVQESEQISESVTSMQTTAFAEETSAVSKQTEIDSIPYEVRKHAYPKLDIDWEKHLGNAAVFMDYNWFGEIDKDLAEGGTPANEVKFELLDIDNDYTYEMLMYNRSAFHGYGGVEIYKAVNGEVVDIGTYPALADFNSNYSCNDDLPFDVPEAFCDVYKNNDGQVRFVAMNHGYTGAGSNFDFTMYNFHKDICKISICANIKITYPGSTAVYMGVEDRPSYFVGSIDEEVSKEKAKEYFNGCLEGWTKVQSLPPIELPSVYSMDYYWQFGYEEGSAIYSKYADEETANNNLKYGFAEALGLTESICTISENEIEYNRKKMKIDIEMTDGKSSENNYAEGCFEIVVYDDKDILCRYSINEDEKILKDFTLAFNDYNGDGNYDFTIGHDANGSLSVYNLYTIDKNGQIEWIGSNINAAGKTPSIFLNKEEKGWFSSVWRLDDDKRGDYYLDEEAVTEWMKDHDKIDFVKDYYGPYPGSLWYEKIKSVPCDGLTDTK